MADANLEIGLVGKRLVHYKHYKPLAKRPPTQLSGKGVLEKFLQKHRAILLPETTPLTPAAGGRDLAGRKPDRRRAAEAGSYDCPIHFQNSHEQTPTREG